MPVADAIYFCPNCGSAAVDTPLLAGGSARCRSCGWAGDAKDLVASVISEDAKQSPEQFILAFARDFRLSFAKECGPSLMRLLVKWGFIPAVAERKIMVELLGRYLGAAARGSIKAIFEERAKIETEGAKNHVA